MKPHLCYSFDCHMMKRDPETKYAKNISHLVFGRNFACNSLSLSWFTYLIPTNRALPTYLLIYLFLQNTIKISFLIAGLWLPNGVSEMSCSESTSSCQSLEHGSVPEILIGLLYNATTGRLSAEVIKGSHFKNLAANRPPSEWKLFLILMFSVLTGF